MDSEYSITYRGGALGLALQPSPRPEMSQTHVAEANGAGVAAGVRAGDHLVSVAGVDVRGRDVPQVVELLRRMVPPFQLTFLRPAEAPSIPVTFAAPPATRVSPARAPHDDLDARSTGAPDAAARHAAASLAAADEPSSGRVGAPPDAETWARQAADRAKSAASAASTAGLRAARPVAARAEPPRAAVAASASLIAAAAAPAVAARPADVAAAGAGRAPAAKRPAEDLVAAWAAHKPTKSPRAGVGPVRSAPPADPLVALGLEFTEDLVRHARAPAPAGPVDAPTATLAARLVAVDAELRGLAARARALVPAREAVWTAVVDEEAAADAAAKLCHAERVLLEQRGDDAALRSHGAFWADAYDAYAARARAVRGDLGGVEDALLALLERIRQGAKLGDTLACLLEEPGDGAPS